MTAVDIDEPTTVGLVTNRTSPAEYRAWRLARQLTFGFLGAWSVSVVIAVWTASLPIIAIVILAGSPVSLIVFAASERSARFWHRERRRPLRTGGGIGTPALRFLHQNAGARRRRP